MSFETVMNEEILNKLAEAETEGEVLQTLKENGVSFEDTVAFIEYIQNDSGELNEEALENVAGGGYLHNVLARTAYRIKHKKLFVKTTVKGDVIIVTNRFGEKISEEYFY